MTPMPSWEKRRRATSAAVLVAFGLAVCVGVSGCTPQDPAPTTAPSPTAVPTAPVALPTNEEALVIVEELVQAASVAEASARASGDYAELELIAGSDYVAQARSSNEKLAAAGLTITGDKTVDSLEIQSITTENTLAVIQSYGCLDISQTQLTDSSGADARKADVPLRVAVVFRAEGNASDYRLMETSPWSGPSSC